MSSSMDNSSIAKDDTIRKDPGVSGSNGASAGFRPSHTPGRSDNPLISVEPPRRERGFAAVLCTDSGRRVTRATMAGMEA
ncbi:hypothetical protein LZ554_009425 [Drepanopeziza brunnea f. sp. 'monogermtubi']|nr:hypothetical protein LZ554_009425 [Drepanopeziza brunnea f. sp. 'monogermtubi']